MQRTQVGIVGAGPAGLMLGALLSRAGVETTILELHDRDYVESRVRAGMLEHGTVELLTELGVADRLRREGFEHRSFEVRFDGRRHHIPMAELTGGRTTWMYPQQELVKDLIAHRVERDEPLVFQAHDVRLEGIESDRPRIVYECDGDRRTLECDLIAGCDGYYGVSRPSIPDTALRTFSRDHPFAWLGILAEAPPVTTSELIYAHHPCGFALHSFRSAELGRMYLQVGRDEAIDDWSHDRIWEELRTRLATDDGWELGEGPILQKSIMNMRSFVVDRMQYGSLFLAGDAAHIVPPTAAKGLNLAAADACLLAQGMVDRLKSGLRYPLELYSYAALRRVWQIEEFSSEMTATFHHVPSDDFGARLQRARLDRLCTSRPHTAAFCDVYAGLPLGGAPLPAGPDATPPEPTFAPVA